MACTPHRTAMRRKNIANHHHNSKDLGPLSKPSGKLAPCLKHLRWTHRLMLWLQKLPNLCPVTQLQALHVWLCCMQQEHQARGPPCIRRCLFLLLGLAFALALALACGQASIDRNACDEWNVSTCYEDCMSTLAKLFFRKFVVRLFFVLRKLFQTKFWLLLF